MILSKDESICLILSLSDKNRSSSTTKLNKLLARLNLFFIPIDFSFELNKFGSFNIDLKSISSNEYFEVKSYEYKGVNCKEFVLKENGKELFKESVLKKLNKILKEKELEDLKKEIHKLSLLSAQEISNNEHKELLVDTEDRFKLENRLNEVLVDLFDLFNELDKIKEDSIAAINLKALIEYSYYLIKFLKEMKFKRIAEDEYDFEAHMYDYYFLNNIKKIIPFLREQLIKEDKDQKTINKYYQYIINSVRETDYPFSIENKDLKDLIIA